MAGIDRWLHYTVTAIDRFHCIILCVCMSVCVHTCMCACVLYFDSCVCLYGQVTVTGIHMFV